MILTLSKKEKVKFHIRSKNINSKNETKILLIFILKVFVKNAALNAPSNYIVFEITVFIAHVLNSNN
jgi:hypothetical protein